MTDNPLFEKLNARDSNGCPVYGIASYQCVKEPHRHEWYANKAETTVRYFAWRCAGCRAFWSTPKVRKNYGTKLEVAKDLST